MADIVVKTHNGNETYTGIESVTFNTTQEGVKATFIAQKQADWLQDDETAVDYIKNKPFYENGDTVVKLDNKYLNILEEENVNKNVILAEQNIADFDYNTTFGAFWVIRYSILAELVEGQEYTIVWDGIEYVRTAFAFTNPTDGTSCIAVGNKMVSTGVDDGDLFAIVNDITNNHTHLFSTEDKTEHSVAIYQAAAATYKINKTYLPDDIGKQSDWNQTDDTAVDFIKNKPEDLATQTYVQEQIAAIDIPEAPEQVQANWNENDETSKAFVQNRPFYVLGDWVKQTTGTFTLDKYAKNNIRSSAIQCGSLPAEGEVFKVIWDGTEYECIMTFYYVANAISVGVIGNPKILAEYYGNQVVPPDTGEPFCFSYGFKAVYTRSTVASHTFRIYYKDSVVKLDEKFIPASVKLPSVTTDDNGKALIVTNGEWTASQLDDETQSDWNEIDETSKAFILNKPEIPSIDGLATEIYVQEQIANIEDAAEQLQADWEQTNATEKDFIQNKPFGLLPDILVEQDLTFNQKEGFYDCEITQVQRVIIGRTYRITWDGTTYELVAKDAKDIPTGSSGVVPSSSPYFGNSYIVGVAWGQSDWGVDTGEPFVININNTDLTANISTTDLTKATHTVSIVPVDNKKKLAAEWLPDGLATEVFVREQIAAIEIPEGGGSGGSVSTEKVFLEETEIENAFNLDGLIGAQIPFTDCLNIGETYYVNWNSVEYEVTNAQDVTALMQNLIGPTITKAIAMGNGEIFELSGNNEPFTIITTGELIMFADLSPEAAIGGKNTVRIYQRAPLTVSWENVTDKPFGEEIVTVFEGTFQDTLKDGDGDGVNDAWEGFAMLEDSSDATLVLGQTYTVTVDGVEYELVCVSYQGLPCIGSSVITMEVPDDIPFIIMRDAAGIMGDGQVWALAFISPPTDLTISGKYDVKITSGGIKCLDNKYLSILENDGEELIPETMMEFTYQPSEDLSLWAGSVQTMTEAAYNALYSKAGEQVLVMFDGAEYLCNVLLEDESSSIIFLGNVGIFPSATVEDTGEPFYIMVQRTGAEGSYEYVWNIATNEPAPADTSITIEHTVGVILNPGYKIKDEYLSILEGFEDKETEIYPEDTWSTQLDDNFGYALARPFGEELPVFPLTIGDECIVVWDGEEYKVTVDDLSSLMPNAIFVGNGTALELPGNNEPFLIGWDATGVTFAALTDTEPTEHTVRIYQKIEGGYKIKESYIPDSVKLPVATAEDNNKFLRVVDGVPTWVALTDVSTEGA